MSNWQLKTPVAFLIFNRPDTTEKVFEEIRRARPPKLLVVADGARADKSGDAEKCKTVRAIIERVDWPCDVLTNYSDTNLGCKRRVSSGLDWVFDNVEEAIILEDDCLPHPTFFRFCEELLERYRDDARIMMISGDNFQFGHRRNDDSYYFSRYTHIWGWASWRDRWQDSYDVSMAHWPKVREEGWIHDMLQNPKEARYWEVIFERVFRGAIDTWDYQWTFACWLQGRLTVLPNQNLISNIGFGPDATYTTVESALANLQTEEMCFPLIHPHGVTGNHTLDDRAFKRVFSTPLYRRVKNKMVRMLGL